MSSSKGSRSNRQTSSSKPSQMSTSFQSSTPSGSRQFLNMLNPMARGHQGYMQANQFVVEEDDENRNSGEGEDDLEAGRSQSTIFHSTAAGRGPSPRSQQRKQIAWDAGASEMNVLHPNIHKEDKIHEENSSDDEVPQSFMIEAAAHTPPSSKVSGKARDNRSDSAGRRNRPLHSVAGRKVPPVLPVVNKDLHPSLSIPPRPSELDRDEDEQTPRRTSSVGFSETSERQPRPMRGLDEYEKALWNWVNVYNLDAFLQEVYYYYEGKGIYSIALARGLNLLTVGFVIGFSTFLLGCIDYSKFRHPTQTSTKLSDVVVDHCVARFSGFTLLFFLLFTAFYIWQIITFVLGIMRLVDMYKFYTYLLKIPDADIQTISWSEVVRRIGAIREDNPITAISSKNGRKTNDTTTAKLDAHDIANRIMRQENYLIALFNKDLLDLRVPLPYALKRFVAQEQGKGKLLTQALEWNLRFCLMEYLFDAHGRVRKVFLKSKNRAVLIEGLRRRFFFMSILNGMFAPFIVLYLLMYSFFRYFEEYHKDPSTIGGRRYTSYAQWKFREFNELPHFFVRRLDESYPVASMYIGQFPDEKMTLIMRFVAFIAGSFAAVLVLATVLDPDLFFNFEISPHRTVVFYLGVFGAILTATRSVIPDDNRVFDPELLMSEVITYTHYMPEEWKTQLHSKNVHQEFGQLFKMKIIIFVQELLSVVLTPFVLWFSLPDCAPAIIDFFREFSVHVEGRGYVCSFAEFNFERHGNVKFGAPTHIQDQKMISNEGKMEKSFLNFKATNPDWNPTDPSGSLYLSRMADLSAHHPFTLSRRRHGGGSHTPQYQQHTSQHAHDPSGPTTTVVHFAEEPHPRAGGMESSASLADKAHEYDRALRLSQLAAGSRRRAAGSGSALLGMSTLGIPGGLVASSSASAVFRGIQDAQSVMLGESHVVPSFGAESDTKSNVVGLSVESLDDDATGLGESYADGAKRVKMFGDTEEDEGRVDDGGVLGLLAQIYGRSDGPRVI